MFFEEELVEDFYIYKYQFIDELNYIFSPEDVYCDKELMHKQIDVVKYHFLQEGWEGDGNIGIIWIPPFLDESYDNNCGICIWHVKQNNDGISYLASKKELKSDRLNFNFEVELKKEINESEDFNKFVEVTITEAAKNDLISQLDKLIEKLQEAYKLNNSKNLSDDLYNSLVVYIQNEIIADFNVFLDECYLKFLIHVLNDNNSDNIKLRPIKTNIKLDEISMNSELGYAMPEMVIKQVITNCWRDYKFLSFNEKLINVIKYVGYNCDENLKKEIIKHVTYEEIMYLIKEAERFANDFNEYIKKRMKSREAKKDNYRDMKELSKYIYYLLYEEKFEEVELNTKSARFIVYEGHPLKVNYEDSTIEELYMMLDQCGGKVECNEIIFYKINNEYITKNDIMTKTEEISTVIEI